MSADWTKILGMVGEAAARAIAAYNEAQRLAAQNGVSPAEISAATAKYLRHVDDPLAGSAGVPPADPPSTRPFALETLLNFQPEWKDIRDEWFVQHRPGTIGSRPAWIVKQRGIGKPEPESAGWVTLERP